MIDETLLEAEEKMEKAVTVAKDDFNGIRTGRVTPAMFNKITAEYYGTPTPINQLASFTAARAAHGHRSALRHVLHDGDREGHPRQRPRCQPGQRRQDHPCGLPRPVGGAPQGVHQGGRAQGGGRAGLDPQLRRHAKDALDKLAKDGEAGEDDVRRAEKELDDFTHKHVAKIDEMLEHKKAELLEV